MRVTNMRSPRTGSKVANQFVIESDDSETFQSYDTTIAIIGYGVAGVTLDTSALDYSVTTSKYLYRFISDRLGGDWTRKDVLAAIASGRFKVADLNPDR